MHRRTQDPGKLPPVWASLGLMAAAYLLVLALIWST